MRLLPPLIAHRFYDPQHLKNPTELTVFVQHSYKVKRDEHRHMTAGHLLAS
jgi:hypothetical protein